MKTQKIQDDKGRITGVFIPIKEWNKIKARYPEIDLFDEDIPQWEKDLIDQRLERIANNPDSLIPIEQLFEELKRKY